MVLNFLFMVDLKKAGKRILTKFIEILPPNLHFDELYKCISCVHWPIRLRIRNYRNQKIKTNKMDLV